jgi:oligoribonuclease
MKLIWLDLETTGLDPSKHAILEVAAGVADLLSAPVGPVSVEHFVLRFQDVHTYGPKCSVPPVPSRFGSGGVAPSGGYDDRCPACDFATEARAMHAKSGLLTECGRAKTTMGEVEDYLLTLVHGEPERGDDKPTLAGSTVHFDLGFLRVHAPRFAARVSHRCYDVSAVKLFCESLGMPRIPKGNAHRAADDVMESVRHARQCVEWLRQLCSRSTDASPPIWNVTFGPQPTDDAPRVHVLYEGLALCGFWSGVPGEWPPGHRWVSYQEEGVLDHSNCDACKANFHNFNVGQRLAPPEPDAHCATTPDGGCASTDAECMHQPKG